VKITATSQSLPRGCANFRVLRHREIDAAKKLRKVNSQVINREGPCFETGLRKETDLSTVETGETVLDGGSQLTDNRASHRRTRDIAGGRNGELGKGLCYEESKVDTGEDSPLRVTRTLYRHEGFVLIGDQRAEKKKRRERRERGIMGEKDITSKSTAKSCYPKAKSQRSKGWIASSKKPLPHGFKVRIIKGERQRLGGRACACLEEESVKELGGQSQVRLGRGVSSSNQSSNGKNLVELQLVGGRCGTGV